MIEDNMVTGEPSEGTSAQENQASKSFTQEDIDSIVKERLDRERKKFAKQFEGIDIEKYRELTAKEENIRLEQEKSRGNFEKVLQETVGKKRSNYQTVTRPITIYQGRWFIVKCRIKSTCS